jgi:hypothetical protein
VFSKPEVLMKSKLSLAAISFMVLILATCQTTPPSTSLQKSTPAAGTTTEFFKEEAGRWLSIALPKGWVAKLGDDGPRAPIVITDDWERYQNKDLDKDALGIIVAPLTDKGSPEQILGTVVGRLGNMLAERQGEVTVTQQGNQKYAWADYTGVSLDDGTPLRYLLAVIATGSRSVFAFTSTPSEQVESVRPKFQEIVQDIMLH